MSAADNTRHKVIEAIFSAIAGIRPEQAEKLRLARWKLIEPERVRDIEAQLAAHKGKRVAIGAHAVANAHACYLYLSEVGEAAAAEMIWDTRPETDEPQTVPHFITHHDTGQSIPLYAHSGPIWDYVIAQGDRVFMSISEATAREHAATLLREIEQDAPEQFAKITQKYASRDEAIEVASSRMLQAGIAILEPASAGLIEALAKQRAEQRAEAARAKPADGGGLQLPKSAFALSDADRGELVHFIGERLRSFMRANVGTSEGHWPSATLSEAAHSTRIHRFFLPSVSEASAEQWLKLQRALPPGRERFVTRVDSGRRYAMELQAWWVGLEISTLGSAPIEVGAVLDQRITTPDTPELFGLPTEWSYMLEHETLEEMDTALQRLLAVKDEGGARLKHAAERIDQMAQAGLSAEEIRDTIEGSGLEAMRIVKHRAKAKGQA